MQKPQNVNAAYFADPAIDRLLGAVMTLAAELHVARDHAKVLECILIEKGVLAESDVESFRPESSVADRWDAERDEFVHALMSSLRGLSHAKESEARP